MRKFNKKLELCLKWKMFQTIFGSKFQVTSLAIKLPTGCKFAILHNIHYVNLFYHLIGPHRGQYNSIFDPSMGLD